MEKMSTEEGFYHSNSQLGMRLRLQGIWGIQDRKHWQILAVLVEQESYFF